MLADALPERAAASKADQKRRVAAGAVVLLLHIVLIFGLLHAVAVHNAAKTPKEIPIVLLVPKVEKKPLPPTKTEEKKPQEQPFPPAPTLTTAPITVPPVHPPPTGEDGVKKMGNYLQNCSSGNFDALTPQQWADCLGGAATRDSGTTVKLGDVRTLWEKQHPPKTPKYPNEADGFVECPRNMPNHNLGLPCFQHNGQKPQQ